MSPRLPPALAGPPWVSSFPLPSLEQMAERAGLPEAPREETERPKVPLCRGASGSEGGPGERGGSGAAAATEAGLATARPVDSRGGTGCRSAGWAGSVTPGTVTGWLEEEPGPDPECGVGWGSEDSMNSMGNTDSSVGREGC